MKIKFLSFAFALLMLLSIFPFGVLAAESGNEAVTSNVVNLTNTKIEDDFKYAFAGFYDVKNYPANSKDKELHFVTAMEGKGSSGMVELYFYVYNPSRKVIVKDTNLDKISLATYSSKDDSTKDTYSKKDLTLIKTYGATQESGSNTNALLLKYKLEITKSYDNTVDRYYRLADIEILFRGESTATAYLCGKEFKFFDSDYCVNCSVQDLTTLEMDSFHTFYRVNTDGVDYYTDIQSIYFPVPNSLLKAYGGLYAMDVTWQVSHTSQCLVVEDEAVRDEFYNNWIKSKKDDFKYTVFYKKIMGREQFLFDTYLYGHNVNSDKLSEYVFWGADSFVNTNYGYFGYKSSETAAIKPYPDFLAPGDDSFLFPITMVFTVDDATSYEAVSVRGEEILAYLEKENWDSSIFLFGLPPITYEQKFTVDLVDKKLGIYETCSGWEEFWHGDVYEKDTGEEVVYSAFQQIDSNDLKTLTVEEFSKKYLIDIKDVKCDIGSCGNCFSCRRSNDKYSDCTWFLLRYDTTNYRSYDALIMDNETGSTEVCNANLFETDVIRNFDTISVTLKDTDDYGKDVFSTFSILRSPTNFVADAWNPSEKPELDFGLKDTDFWDILERILKIAAIVILVLVVFKIWDIVKPLVKGAFGIVSAPFKKLKRKDKK